MDVCWYTKEKDELNTPETPSTPEVSPFISFDLAAAFESLECQPIAPLFQAVEESLSESDSDPFSFSEDRPPSTDSSTSAYSTAPSTANSPEPNLPTGETPHPFYEQR